MGSDASITTGMYIYIRVFCTCYAKSITSLDVDTVNSTLVALLKNMFSLLTLAEAPNFILSDLMALPEEQDDKEE